MTSTRPENAIHDAAQEARSLAGQAAASVSAEKVAARRRLLLIAEALEEEVAWHSPARFQVAANIARDMLSSPNARANERLLYEQKADWDAIRLQLRARCWSPVPEWS